jgi:hypothetical protein
VQGPSYPTSVLRSNALHAPFLIPWEVEQITDNSQSDTCFLSSTHKYCTDQNLWRAKDTNILESTRRLSRTTVCHPACMANRMRDEPFQPKADMTTHPATVTTPGGLRGTWFSVYVIIYPWPSSLSRSAGRQCTFS